MNKEASNSTKFSGIMTEYFFQSVFGKKYHGTASAFQNNNKYFKNEIMKLIDRFISDVKNLIATEDVIENLLYQLGYLKKELSVINDPSNEVKGLLIINLKLFATLLGYNRVVGRREQEPYFIPTLWSEKKGWRNLSEYQDTKEHLEIETRIKIIKDLRKKKHTVTEIALIMNLSNYKTAQLLKKIEK